MQSTEIEKYRILLPGLLDRIGDGYARFFQTIALVNEFYNRHKLIIDALAKDDEMFRAIKEISETRSARYST